MEAQISIDFKVAPEEKFSFEKLEVIAERVQREVLRAKNFKDVALIAEEVYIHNLSSVAQTFPWFESTLKSVTESFEKKGLRIVKSEIEGELSYFAVNSKSTAKHGLKPWGDFKQFQNIVSKSEDLQVLFFLNSMCSGFDKDLFVRLYLMSESCPMELILE